MVYLMHLLEAEVMYEIADMLRYGDGLVSCDGSQGAAVEVVKMGVRYQHQVDRRQIVNLDARVLDALDHLQPLRPIGVDQHAVLGCLDEKGRMPDPRNGDLPGLEFGKDRLDLFPMPFREERGDHHLGEEVALVPAIALSLLHL